MLNKLQVIGRLGKDPESKTFPDGGKIVNVSLAAGEKWKDKDGNVKESTEWFNLQFRGKLADVAEKYLHKGDLVYVEGPLRSRQYQDKDGNTRTATEIHVTELKMLGSPGSKSEPAASAMPETSAFNPNNSNPGDDLPF